MDNNTINPKTMWNHYFHPPEYLSKHAIAITGAGNGLQDETCHVINRRYPSHTFVLSYSDGASIDFRGKHNDLGKYDCFFIPENEIHTYGTNPGQLWNSYWVSFKSNNSIAEVWGELLPVPRKILGERIRDLMEQIHNCTKYNAVYEEYSAILFNMMAALRSPQRTEILSETQQNIENSRDYIIENLTRNISLEDVAEQAGFSATHFARLFKKRYGIPVNEYIIGRRLAKAQILLAQTQMPIKQISHKTGFADQLYFSRIFKKKLHITPSDFRKYYR